MLISLITLAKAEDWVNISIFVEWEKIKETVHKKILTKSNHKYFKDDQQEIKQRKSTNSGPNQIYFEEQR